MEIRDWLGYVETETTDNPAAMLRAIRDALSEFCEVSQVWRTEECPAMNVVANTSAYTLKLPVEEASIVDVLELDYNGTLLTGATERELDGIYGIGSDLRGSEWMWGNVTGVQGWRSLTAGVPEYYYLLPTRQVRLVPIPTTALANGLTPKLVSLKPSHKAREVPDFLYEHYRRDISLGAKAYLLKQVNVPWSAPQEGKMLYQEFIQKAAEAKMRSDNSGLLRNVVVGSTLFGGYEGEG